MVDVATVVGVPVNAPVEVLKLIPAGAAGEIAKLEIAPPVEVIENPVAAVFTTLDSDEDVSVKAGAARVGACSGVGSGVGGATSVVIGGEIAGEDPDAEAEPGDGVGVVGAIVEAPAILIAVIVNV